MKRKITHVALALLLSIVLLLALTGSVLAVTGETLDPSGNLSGQQLNAVGVPTGYNYWAVNDATHGTYVWTNSADWLRDRYYLDDTTGSGEIISVTVWIYARRDSSGAEIRGSARTYIRTYSNDYYGNPIELETDWNTYYTQYDTNPFTGLAWTWSEVDALLGGVSLRSATTGSVSSLCSKVWVYVTYDPSNQPPVADAGSSQTFEQTSSAGTQVTLDGTGSYDPDGDVITYSWSASGIIFDDPTSPTPTATFPAGSTDVVLTVTDPFGESSTDSIQIDIVDTTPADITVSESTTPSGKKTPRGKPDHNADGFFEITAEDDVSGFEEIEIFIEDTGSGTVFGPFDNGVKIKYDIDPLATPEQKTMGSNKGKAKNVDWHIIGQGVGEVSAVDLAGIVSSTLLE
ncbi:PKD domain-containing protein [Chloroflexota bacterium]